MNTSRVGSIRSSKSVALLIGALLMSLALGAGYLVINGSSVSGADHPAEPLTDDQAAGQVVGSARQIVSAAQLREVTGGYIFLSCKNEDEPPYQAAAYLNFRLPQVNSVKYLREISAVMVAHGWKQAPSLAEHFGKKLTKDGVTSVFYRNTDKRDFGTMHLYGECRTMADHRNDDPAWTEITEQLRLIGG